MKVIFLLLISTSCFAQQTAQKHIREIDYLLYLPDSYGETSTESWPLIIYLHGAGSEGNTVEKLKRSAIPRLIEEGMKLPFVVISPQAREQGWNIRDLKNLVETEIRKYQIDTDRIYLTGYSMGGTGTWDFATAYPEFFAAIVPVCGEVNDDALVNVYQLQHVPVWCFHGGKDSIISVLYSKRMIDSLRIYNPEAKLTVYPEAGHAIWQDTYTNNALYEWLLQQKRFVNRVIPISEERLNEYASFRYALPEQASIAYFTVEDGGLRLWVDGNKGDLIKPMEEDIFFLHPDQRKYLTFHRNSVGEITGLTLYEYNNKIFCRNIGKTEK